MKIAKKFFFGGLGGFGGFGEFGGLGAQARIYGV